MQLLTNSRRNSFGTCHRRHQFEYELGARPVSESAPLRFGTLVHACLERWWMLAAATPAERLIEINDVLYANLQAGMDAYEVAKARGMMVGYERRWGNLDEIQIIAVEIEYRAPLMNPETGAASRTFELAGKLDALAVINGRLMIVEHKTTSEDVEPGSHYWDKLAIDGQVSGYYVGAQTLGHQVDGCLYDVLRKPGIKPRQIPTLDEAGKKIVLDADGNRVYNKDGKIPKQSEDKGAGHIMQTRPETPDEYATRVATETCENPDRYFGRKEVPRLESDLVEYLDDMWTVGRELADAQRLQRWPRNPRSCDGFGTCPYFEVCCGRASIEDARLFQVGAIHRELPSAVSEEATR